MSFELGPVLRFETRRVARRQGDYALRIVFCVAMMVMLGLYQWAFASNLQQLSTPARTKELLASTTAGFLAIVHIVIALVLAPIAAASAFPRLRVRTFMPTLLATPLSAWRIVVETVAARLFPVLSLWLCLVPLTLFMVLWCAVDPEFVAILEIVTLGTIMVSVTAAVALALWSGRLYVALFGVYGVWGGWLLVSNLGWWSWPTLWAPRIHPYVLVFSRWNGRRPTLDDAWFYFAVMTTLSLTLIVLMALTFRRVVLAKPRPRKPRARWPSSLWRSWLERLPGPTLDGNPVLWREWWRARTSLAARAFWVLYALAAAVATVDGTLALWHGQRPPDLAAVVGYEVGIGLLAITVRAASAWSDEKGAGREAIDVLLTTPLSASTFVTGKWWGAYRGVLLLAILPILAEVVMAVSAPTVAPVPARFTQRAPLYPLRPVDRALVVGAVMGQVLIYGALYVSLGVLLATRFPGPGRAVTAAVLIYLGVAVFVPTLAEIVFLPFFRPVASGFALVSPIGGPIVMLASMFDASFSNTRALVWTSLVWSCVAGGVSWALIRWTIHGFDRWMGRMPCPSVSQSQPA
jgi:hypothetical protein